MALFREATFEVGDKTYTFTPSFALLDKIESKGLSAEKLSYEAMNGNVMKASMARFIGIVLRHAGVEVTDERMLQEIEHHPKEALDLFMQIRNALYTQPPEDLLLGIKDEGDKKKDREQSGLDLSWFYTISVCEWSLQPSEFWGMTLAEFWALMKYYRDKNLTASGKLTPERERDLREWVNNGTPAS